MPFKAPAYQRGAPSINIPQVGNIQEAHAQSRERMFGRMGEAIGTGIMGAQERMRQKQEAQRRQQEIDDLSDRVGFNVPYEISPKAKLDLEQMMQRRDALERHVFPEQHQERQEVESFMKGLPKEGAVQVPKDFFDQMTRVKQQPRMAVPELETMFDASMKSAGRKDTDDIREYSLAVEQGYQGTLEDWLQGLRRSGAAKTDITIGQSEYGAIPQGYSLKRDEGGGLSMLPIPGGPAEREIIEAEKKAEERIKQGEKYADVVTEDIDRAINLAKGTDFPIAGFFGSMASKIPGNPAHDFSELMKPIRSNLSFDRLREMRASSPTGGALGQVSNFENELLQSVLGSIEQSQNLGQLIYNLRRVKDVYSTVMTKGIPDPAEEPDDEVISLEEYRRRQGR